LISFKQGATGEEDFVATEHERRAHAAGGKLGDNAWEETFQYKPAEICTTLNDEVDHRMPGIPYKPVKWFNDIRARNRCPDEVIALLEKAHNGQANLLLNIGLLGDGSINPEDVNTLRKVGTRIREHGFPV